MRSSRSKPTPLPDRSASLFEAIGTGWRIDTPDPLDSAVLAAVRVRCASFDEVWSRFRDDSLVTRIATTPGRYLLPDHAERLLGLYRDLYERTDGAMTPLVGRALEQHGYDRTYSLRADERIAPVPAWDEAITWRPPVLDTVHPIVIDVGAAGKGYLVDLVAGVLLAHGIAEFTIDASGDILHSDARPLRVALEHPGDPTRAIGVATVASGALCASASNRRAWPGAHHVLDAVTGRPTTRVVATWVTAPSALVADGLATALFFVGADRLKSGFEFEYVRMTASGTIESSPGFVGEVFT